MPMVRIETVVCPECHLKTNARFPQCLHCGKSLSEVAQIGGVMKKSPPIVRPTFQYGQQLVH